MPNPYNITEVDVPGLLNAYEGQQSNRIQRMVTRQQLAAMERQADRDLEEQATIARITGRGGKDGGATGAYATQQPNVGQQVANGIMGAVGVQPAPQPAPQATSRFTPEQIAELRLSGPRGAQMAEALQNMNEQQLALTNRRATAGGQIADELSQIPDINQRRAALMQAAPLLVAQGFTQPEIDAYAADLSNASLAQHQREARLVAAMSRGGEGFTLGEGQVRYDAQGNRVAAGPAARPRYYPVGPGGRLELDPSYQGPVTEGAPPPASSGTLEQQAEEAIRNGANPEQVRARLRQLQGGQPGAAPAFSANAPLTLEDRRNQYPVRAPGRGGSQGPRTFR